MFINRENLKFNLLILLIQKCNFYSTIFGLKTTA